MAVVATPMLDLNHSTIRRGHRGDAQPGGSGYGHRQRSQQRSADQNETSHPFLSPNRVIAMRHKLPMGDLFRRDEAKSFAGLRGRQFVVHRAACDGARRPKSSWHMSGKNGKSGF
jgi:hypothetical protein